MKGNIIRKLIAAGLCVTLPCIEPVSYAGAAEYDVEQPKVWQEGSIKYEICENGYTVVEVVSDSKSLQLSSEYNGSNVVGIEENAFSQCQNLETVILPYTLEYIGDNAFAGCTALEQVVIQEGVERIGEGAFGACGSLESFTIPKSVEEIGDQAFSRNTKLYVYQESRGHVFAINHAYSYQLISNSEKRYTDFRIELPKYEYKVGEALKKDEVIGYGIYEEGSEEVIEDYQLSEDYVFSKTGYQSYTFPYTKNGYNLSAAVWIDVTEEVTGIPEKTIVTDNAEYTYDDVYEGLELISWTDKSKISLEIPEQVQGYPVVSIDGEAFKSVANVTSISLPKTLEYVNVNAFEDCTSLKSINVESGNRFESQDGVLYRTYVNGEMDLIKYPIAKSGNSFVVSENVTDINTNGFSGSKYLKQVTLGKNVTSIPMDAFSNSKSLTDVYVLGDLTQISDDAFEDCTNEITLHANSTSYNNVIEEWLVSHPEIKYSDMGDGTPTQRPTQAPTMTPTKMPGITATIAPTKMPTRVPTKVPTKAPTKAPTKTPTKVPTKAPVIKLSKTSITGKLTSESGVRLSWKKVKNAKGYIVYRSTKKNTGYKQIKKVSGSSKLNYIDTKTKNGTTYYYYVVAYTQSGKKTIKSTKSNVVSKKVIKSLSAPKLNDPIGTIYSIKLSWSKVKNASEYEIYMQVGNGKPKCVKKTKKTSIEVSGEDYGYAQTKCTVSVKAVYKKDSARVESLHSNRITFGR